jgi:hypothetical protein
VRCAAAADPGNAILLQYGAVGDVAVVALLAARVLWKRLSDTLDRETERANRLEAELKALNEMIRTEYVRTIAEASRAVSDAMAAVRRD